MTCLGKLIKFFKCACKIVKKIFAIIAKKVKALLVKALACVTLSNSIKKPNIIHAWNIS